MVPKSEKVRRAGRIVQGEQGVESLRFLRRSVVWVVLAIALDFGSSWIMMSLRGVSSEGNPAMRLLFDKPGLPTVLGWVASQSSWWGILCFPLSGILFLTFTSKVGAGAAGRTLHQLLSLVSISTLLLAWPLALIRIVLGSGSNVAGALSPWGTPVQIVGWIGVAGMSIYLIEHDALCCLFPKTKNGIYDTEAFDFGGTL